MTNIEINNLTITTVAVVMVCAVVFLILLITAVMIMIYTVLKKKAKRSQEQEQQDVSIYESISESDTFTEPMKCEWATNKPSGDNVYDEIKAIVDTTTEFELTDNEAYSTFNRHQQHLRSSST